MLAKLYIDFVCVCVQIESVTRGDVQVARTATKNSAWATRFTQGGRVCIALPIEGTPSLGNFSATMVMSGG